jgi:hypothetical protein
MARLRNIERTISTLKAIDPEKAKEVEERIVGQTTRYLEDGYYQLKAKETKNERK